MLLQYHLPLFFFKKKENLVKYQSWKDTSDKVRKVDREKIKKHNRKKTHSTHNLSETFIIETWYWYLLKEIVKILEKTLVRQEA